MELSTLFYKKFSEAVGSGRRPGKMPGHFLDPRRHKKTSEFLRSEIFQGLLIGESCLEKFDLVVDAIHHDVTAFGELGGLGTDLVTTEDLSGKPFKNLSSVPLGGVKLVFKIPLGADGLDGRGVLDDEGDLVFVRLVFKLNRSAVLGACAVKAGDVGKQVFRIVNLSAVDHAVCYVPKDVRVGVGKAVVSSNKVVVDCFVLHGGVFLSQFLYSL